MKKFSPRNRQRFRISRGAWVGAMGLICMAACALFPWQSASIAETQPSPVLPAEEHWKRLVRHAGELLEGRPDEAVVELEEALSIARTHFGETHPLASATMTLIARAQQGLGRYEAAEKNYLVAIDGLKSSLGDKHPDTLTCQEGLASLYQALGDYEKAGDLLEKVLRIRQETAGAKSTEALETANLLASLYQARGQFDPAEQIFLENLSLFREMRGENDFSAIRTMDYLAGLYEARGRYAEAETYYEKVYLYSEKTFGEKHVNTITSLNNLGDLHRKQGLYAEAEEKFQQALTLFSSLLGDKHFSTIKVMNNLALVYEHQGLYERAEPLLRAAIRNSREMLGVAYRRDRNVIRMMNNLALLYESQGRFENAREIYLETIDLFSELLGDDHPDTMIAVNNLAYLYLLQENYEGARTRFAQALDAWKTTLGEKHPNTLKALNNLARTYHRLGRLGEAESLFLEALQMRSEVLGEDHADTIRSMNDMAALYHSRGKLDEAEALFEKTLQIEERRLGKYHPYTLETLNAYAALQEDRKALGSALELRKTGFDRRNRFLDRVLWATGENARAGFIRLHKQEQDDLVSLLVGVGLPESARGVLDVSLKRKGLLLEIASQIQKVVGMSDSPRIGQMSNRLIEKKKELATLTLSGPAGGAFEDHNTRLDGLEEEIEALQAELGRASRAFKAAIRTVTPEQVVDRLNDDEALIDYLIYKDRKSGKSMLLAVVATRGQDGNGRFNLVPYGELAPIHEGVRILREVIQDDYSPEEDLHEEGMLRYEQLWQPLSPFLAGKNTVYLIPDGILNLMPFDALIDPANGTYLLQGCDVRFLSSGRDLAAWETPGAEGLYYIVAGPDYNADYAGDIRKKVAGDPAIRAGIRMMASVETGELSVSGNRGAGSRVSRGAISRGLRGLSFGPLPGAEKEGITIEKMSRDKKQTVIHTGAEGREKQLRTLMEPPEILHIATHGFFLEPDERLARRLLKYQRGEIHDFPPPGDNPLLRAGLAFAGININAPFLGDMDTDDDGVLTAMEVLGLPLAGVRLVILSACETGLGEIHEGEGIYGLRRAFQEAGVSGVINSLWEVSDEGAQQLMTLLYRQILKGAPIREAFRETRKKMLGDPRWSHPYYWAAFSMVGM